MLQVQHRVLSRPANVYWAGFRSDTLALQQAGWELAADQDIARDRIRLLMRHQGMKLYAITSDMSYEYRRMAYGGEAPLEFHVVGALPEDTRIAAVNVSAVRWKQFEQIDAKPQFVEQTIKCLDDFKIFATPMTRTEEIIVEPQTVSAMLEKIREMQAPEQTRLKEKQRLAARREGYKMGSAPRQVFHAQILSIADYRGAAA